MPELGETWSMGGAVAAGAEATEHLEAIVLATGPSRIRLITRTGRRLTAPVSSWDHLWRLVCPAPSTRRRCEREDCAQEAFFRFHRAPVGRHWVCEDHLPHGVSAQFPGDPDHATDPVIVCLFCDSAVSRGVTIDLRARTTLMHHCSQCGAQWCPLISRGLGDDGTILAQCIHDLKTLTVIPFLEVRMGYRAYRDLCRALGVDKTEHIGGLPIIQDPQLDDQLALVMEQRPRTSDAAPSPRRAAQPLESTPSLVPDAPSVDEQPSAAPCIEGETWVHRDNDDLLITILDVFLPRHSVTIEEVSSSHRWKITFLDLTRHYRRLDIRTYWEILESEEEDAPRS